MHAPLIWVLYVLTLMYSSMYSATGARLMRDIKKEEIRDGKLNYIIYILIPLPSLRQHSPETNRQKQIRS